LFVLGGRFGDQFPLYRAISQQSAEGMASNVETYVDMGYRIFQLKVGGKANDDIERIHAVRAMLDSKVRGGALFAGSW
jgi:L-alanine-DL-glutamate epimerase-like enolase superfamily enzyme